MKKLIFRKVKIVKYIPKMDLSDRMFISHKPRKSKKRERERGIQWFVIDKSTGEELTRLDSYEQAKQYCIKNDYDFGQYL